MTIVFVAAAKALNPLAFALSPLALARDPLDVLACLAGEPGAVLIEVPDPEHPATVLACNPVAELRVDAAERDPLGAIAGFVAEAPAVDPALPFPFGGGVVACLSYELGAAIAPTDPVLASEVQVGPPGRNSPTNSAAGETDGDDTDEVRFALTSEAGLNDGLAFPFTYLAVLLAFVGYAPSRWLGQWLLVYVAYKIVVGVIGGIVIGWLIAVVVFRFSADSPLSRSVQGLEAVAGTLIAFAAV